MLTLGSCLLVGKGEHRECYIHPHKNHLCTKIATDAVGYREMMREQAYYEKLQRRNISWSVLPKFHGSAETNLGPATVFDLIRDFDGEVSKNLKYYLSSAERTGKNYTGLSRALSHLKETLLQERIIIRSLFARNILYKRINLSEGILVIIDDIGNSDFIPIANHIGFIARKKILRKWHRFESALLSIYQHNAWLHHALSKSLFDSELSGSV